MSGHSHWATIRRKKGAVDAKKGQLFSKLARQITIAARTGGGDPESNLSLKYVMDKARGVSMPKDNIERAVKKGTGELEGVTLETAQYEAIGPHGVFILIECLTDNRNRTAPEIKKILEMRNAHLGAVAWAFEPKGVISVPAAGIEEDGLLEIVLEAGGEDLQRVSDTFQVITSPADFYNVRRILTDKGVNIENAEMTQLPKSTVPVDEEAGRKLMGLLGELEDHDDVQNVYSNIEFPESLLSEAAES
jgi:YebC/PmpR family DNA-binding regulatory protein